MDVHWWAVHPIECTHYHLCHPFRVHYRKVDNDQCTVPSHASNMGHRKWMTNENLLAGHPTTSVFFFSLQNANSVYAVYRQDKQNINQEFDWEIVPDFLGNFIFLFSFVCSWRPGVYRWQNHCQRNGNTVIMWSFAYWYAHNAHEWTRQTQSHDIAGDISYGRNMT